MQLVYQVTMKTVTAVIVNRVTQENIAKLVSYSFNINWTMFVNYKF